MMGSFSSGGAKGGWKPLPTKDFATAPVWIAAICKDDISHSG